MFLKLVAEGRMATDEPAVMLAILAGLVYLMIGAMLALGTFAPSTGAMLLNVEDADEIREERPKLQVGSVAYILIGATLLVLAASGDGPDALIGQGLALLIAGACFLGAAVLSLISYRQCDELMRQMTIESSALAQSVGLFVFGGWAILAHLGQVAWLAPLGYLAGFAFLEMLAIFSIVGRRGMARFR